MPTPSHSSRPDSLSPLLASTFDLAGGAAIAAYRLHRGLRAAGIPSRLLVQSKTSKDSSVLDPASKLGKALALVTPTVNEVPLNLFYGNRQRAMFSPQWVPSRSLARVAKLAPDLVNLHWIGNGFFPVEALAQLDVPVVWTLHDMWAFTGGCYYSQECDRYRQQCGACPQLNSSNPNDLSRRVWQRKARSFTRANLTVVTPSRWLAAEAAASSLFREACIEVIPNGIDTQRFRALDKNLARTVLGLACDKKYVLFGAGSATSDPRKGFSLLLAALQKLTASTIAERVELLIFGSSGVELSDCTVPVRQFGVLRDEISLALAYAAADVFVAPSLQDNLPNTVLEALSCGTPCVAFKTGGIPDAIAHETTGYLAHPFDTDDLARGIEWTLADDERHRQLCAVARATAERSFGLELQAQRYGDLFRELVAARDRS